MLASFSRFKHEPGVGANTADEFPTSILNLEVCTEIVYAGKGGRGGRPLHGVHDELLLKVGLTTPSDRFELVFDSWAEAEEWYSSICLAASACYECGKPVLFSQSAKEDRDQSCKAT